MSDFQAVASTATPTEEEMSQVGNLFDRMRNAIIDASHLAGEVAELRRSVSELRSEVEVVRRDNHYLTEQVRDLRNSRDAAVAEAQSQSAARQDAERGLREEVRAHDFTKADLAQAHAKLDQTNRERDDAQLRVMEVEDELVKVKAQLAKIREAMGIQTTNVVEMPKALEPPKAEMLPMSQASGDSWPRGGW